MDNKLIQFADGYLIDIQTSHSSCKGCETCDYGSKYINELKFIFYDKIAIFRVSNMYNYAVSEAWLMNTILPRLDEIQEMSECEFILWLQKQLTLLCQNYGSLWKDEYGVTLEMKDNIVI